MLSKRHKKQCFETTRQNFKKHVLSYFQKSNINDLNIKKIIEWQNIILEKNFKNNYNKNIYSAFNSFLNFCVLNDYTPTNYLSVVGSFTKKIEFREYHTYNLFQFWNLEKD
ncbi:MAG: hypothetical protein HFI08_04765 [Bacilli bacterium]|nr:hypothetical protein [Bacilli bacterium]